MNAALPKTIGRYSIDRRIGSGSMGFVYLGRDPKLQRQVAVKTLKDLGLDADTKKMFLERFRNEARAAATLRHPNIVQIFDTGDDPDSGPFLVFEYIDGETLKQRISTHGPLSLAEADSLAHQIAAALEEAHREGIIHRDIKPDNVLIMADGTAKLADFGIARLPNAALTDEGQFLGTPCYAAPETLRTGAYGVQTDLFSFAALMYELVTGTRAFPGDEAIHVANLVLNETPTPPSKLVRGADLPSAVDALFAKALAKDPTKRFVDAKSMAHAFSAAITDKPRSRWAAVALFAVAACMVGLLTFQDRSCGDSRQGGNAEGGHPHLAHGGGGTLPSANDAGRNIPLNAGDGGLGPRQDAGPTESIDTTDAHLTPHEREEAAKDALAEARRAYAAKNYAKARTLLQRATQLDPTNPDVDALLAQIYAANSDL